MDDQQDQQQVTLDQSTFRPVGAPVIPSQVQPSPSGGRGGRPQAQPVAAGRGMSSPTTAPAATPAPAQGVTLDQSTFRPVGKATQTRTQTQDTRSPEEQNIAAKEFGIGSGIQAGMAISPLNLSAFNPQAIGHGVRKFITGLGGPDVVNPPAEPPHVPLDEALLGPGYGMGKGLVQNEIHNVRQFMQPGAVPKLKAVFGHAAGPAGEEFADEATKGDVSGMAGTGAAAAAPFLIPEIGKLGGETEAAENGLRGSKTPFEPIEKQTDAYQRATKPGTQEVAESAKQRENFQRAAPHLAEEVRAQPIDPARGLLEGADAAGNAADRVWQKRVQPALDIYKDRVADGGKIANDIRSTFTDLDKTSKPGVVAAGENLAKSFDRPITVGELSDVVKQLNNDKAVSRYYGMSDMERTQAELGDPSLRSKVTLLDSARDQLLDTVTQSGGKELGSDFAESRKDWGALRRVQREFQEAKVPAPVGKVQNAVDAIRSIYKPATTGVDRTLRGLNDPNRLAAKSLNDLGRTNLFPSAPPAITVPGTPRNPVADVDFTMSAPRVEPFGNPGRYTGPEQPPVPARGTALPEVPRLKMLQAPPQQLAASPLDVPEWRTGTPIIHPPAPPPAGAAPYRFGNLGMESAGVPSPADAFTRPSANAFGVPLANEAGVISRRPLLPSATDATPPAGAAPLTAPKLKGNPTPFSSLRAPEPEPEPEPVGALPAQKFHFQTSPDTEDTEEPLTVPSLKTTRGAPVAERYSPDTIKQAEAELKAASDLASNFQRPGRFKSVPEDESDLKSVIDAPWYGINSSRKMVSDMFPWYKDESFTPSKLASAADKLKGADYERIIDAIAQRIEKKPATAIPAQDFASALSRPQQPKFIQPPQPPKPAGMSVPDQIKALASKEQSLLDQAARGRTSTGKLRLVRAARAVSERIKALRGAGND